MAVDLKSNASLHRYSLLIMGDALIKLEHERTQDRMRRYTFDTIQNVIIWQKTPWVRIAVCAVLLVLPGVGILFFNDTTATVIGCFLIAMGCLLLAYYSYCKVTTIRIVRAGKHYDCEGLFRPGKVRRFRDKLVQAITAAQSGAAPPVEQAAPAT